MAEFDGWAPYYDLIHKGLPGEAEFYVGQAVRRKAKTLELGCGTGRLAIPMAMSGIQVTGLDNSQPMLDLCRIKLEAVEPVPGTLTLVHADMKDFDLDEQFDLAIMAYRTLMHLLTPDDQRQCLTAVRRHLTNDGRLILNVWTPKPTLIAPYTHNDDSGPELAGQFPIPGTSDMVLHYCSSVYDEFHQLIVEKHTLHEVGQDGTIVDEVDLPLVRAWITPREMDHLVRLAGFEVDAVFGDFDCNPFTETSTEMIWALRPAD